MGRTGRFSWLFVCLALWPLGCSRNAPRVLEGVPVVRVVVLEGQPRVTLSAQRPPTASVGTSQPRELKLARNDDVTVELTPTGWRVGEATFDLGVLTMEPAGDGSLSVNGKSYRGSYRFVPSARAGQGRFDVVNHVDLEGYVKSVLPKELLWNWHEEAYRAQAVVARTYALYETKMAGSSRHFDLYADTRSQVYGGMGAESAKSQSAGDATAGVVVAFGEQGQEKIFKAYFSSCCGGVTQTPADAFGQPFPPPLIERNVGTMCKASPKFNWGPIVVPKDELTRRFRLWGTNAAHSLRDMGTLVSLDIQTTNRFGRPTRFVVTDSKNLRYSLTGEEVRWAVNSGAAPGTTLNSSFMKPITEEAAIRFAEGHGWGHGVGMCQWCIESQAESGLPHESIVLSAFPGAILARAY